MGMETAVKKSLTTELPTAVAGGSNADLFVIAEIRDLKRQRSLARVKAWAAANPDKAKLAAAKRYRKNREKIAAKHAEWRQVNWQKHREMKKRWKTDNKKLVCLASRRRRAKKKGAEGTFSKFDIDRIFEAQRGKCAYFKVCRQSLRHGYEIDHILAISKGGSNWPSNLQLTCGACNAKKHAKDPIDHAQSMGMLL
jgi:5-methylcytosine-specific restriction endonuclease McrA